MRIRVRNAILDAEFKHYGVQSLNDLDNEQLVELARKLGANETWIMDKEVKNRRRGLDRAKTMVAIEASTTFDGYMGSQYWEPEHDKLDEENQIRESLKDFGAGGDTFKLMEVAGIGFYRLKPGETRNLNVSKGWLEDEFLISPLAAASKSRLDPIITVTDESGEILNLFVEWDKHGRQIRSKMPLEDYIPPAPRPTATVEEDDDDDNALRDKLDEGSNEIDIEELGWNPLRAMAKGLGIKTNGKTREDIITLIKEGLNTQD